MSHTVDELYAVYAVTKRRARLARPCGACGLLINAGDRYADVRVVFNGRAQTIRRCGRCETVHEHLRDRGEWQDLWPDEWLNCGEDYEDLWGEEPPADIQAVIFATAEEASGLLS